MQGLWEVFKFYWGYGGNAILFFGLPAVIVNLLSHVFEEPVLRAVKDRYYAEMLGHPSTTGGSRYETWCINTYDAHRFFFDASMDLLKLASYVLAFAFGYDLFGTMGVAGLAVLLLPMTICIVRKPTIVSRARPLVEADNEFVDMLEKEVDASDDEVAKLESLLGYIRTHEAHPEVIISSLLARMAARTDDVGAKSRDLLGRG